MNMNCESSARPISAQKSRRTADLKKKKKALAVAALEGDPYQHGAVRRREKQSCSDGKFPTSTQDRHRPLCCCPRDIHT